LAPQEIQQLQGAFAQLDKDKSGEISAVELSTQKFDGVQFGIETCLMLVKVFDKDKSGQISFFEFASLHKFVVSMKQAFQGFDRDRSGSIEYNEVQQAVAQGGFHLHPNTLQMVFQKYLSRHPSNQNKRPGQPPMMKGLNLELFVQLCAYLGASRSVFAQYDYQRSGFVTINLDQYVLMGL